LSKCVVHIIFTLIAAGIIAVNYKPIYNWDILPYMALALNHSVSNSDSVHSRVYNVVHEGQLKGEITNGTFGNLTKRIPFRVSCYENAHVFNAQLFYYRTKPLYNWLVWLLYSAGFSLIHATIIPSLAAAWGILLILYAWMSVYTRRITALVLTILVAMLPAFIELQNTSSPDALSAFLVLLTLYLLFTGKEKKWIWASLVLAVLCRVDNFIFAGVVFTFMYNPPLKRFPIVILFFVTIAVTAILIIPLLSGNSWSWFTHFKFLESHVQYYFHVRNVFRAFFADAYYWIWVALGLVLLTVNHKKVRQLMLIITASVIIRLVLFPSLQERFFVPYELALIMAMLMAVNGKSLQPGKTEAT
jgi:hypothetical protein